MAGPDRGDSDRGDGIWSRVVTDYRLAVFITAIVAGGGSGFVGRNLFPPDESVVRPNAFTSIDYAKFEQEQWKVWTAHEHEQSKAWAEKLERHEDREESKLRRIRTRHRNLVAEVHQKDVRLSRLEKEVQICKEQRESDKRNGK